MAHFRIVVPDDLWVDVQKQADHLHVPPKALFNTCAGIGMQFIRLGLNPPPEMLQAALAMTQGSPTVRAATEKALNPLAKYVKRVKKKTK